MKRYIEHSPNHRPFKCSQPLAIPVSGGRTGSREVRTIAAARVADVAAVNPSKERSHPRGSKRRRSKLWAPKMETVGRTDAVAGKTAVSQARLRLALMGYCNSTCNSKG